VVGHGAAELLWSLARAALRPGDRVVIVEPAFSEMRRAAERVGAVVAPHRAPIERGFRVDLDALATTVRTAAPRVLYVATPSNPAGVCTPVAGIGRLAAAFPDTLVVVDASFLSLSVRHAEGDAPPDNVFWLRSLTKDHAVPGLRVGYALTTPEWAARIEAERPPWSVSALAEAAAVAAVTPAAERFVAESRERLLGDREALVDALGLRTHPSDTIFTLVRVGRSASELRRRLLARHGVLVRDATSFGLPEHVRLAARPSFERLALALRKELRP